MAPLLRRPARRPRYAARRDEDQRCDVEAGSLMESIDGVCCSEPTASSPTTRKAVWPVALGASSSLWNDQHCRRASGMLNGGETTGADVLVASLGADSRLLEPLCATHVRGLQCFLDECCAPARAAHAFAHICGAGSDRSRARGPETCVSCANAAPSCIMAHVGLPRCVIREHEHCSTHPEACLDCQCHICAV